MADATRTAHALGTLKLQVSWVVLERWQRTADATPTNAARSITATALSNFGGSDNQHLERYRSRMVKGPPEPKRNRRRPWEDPPKPGPTVVVNVDGVVASMAKFQHLIDAPNYKDRDWKQFHREFRRAELIKPGARLVRALAESGHVIAWSTTRLDQFAATTDNWLRAHQLPSGPLDPRSLFKDGNRAVELVKRRQWWRWTDKFGISNPIIAWIDPEQESVDALRSDGCPAWLYSDLYDQFKAGNLAPSLAAGPEPKETLQARTQTARAVWDEAETVWQEGRQEWRKSHMERLRRRQAESRRRTGP